MTLICCRSPPLKLAPQWIIERGFRLWSNTVHRCLKTRHQRQSLWLLDPKSMKPARLAWSSAARNDSSGFLTFPEEMEGAPGRQWDLKAFNVYDVFRTSNRTAMKASPRCHVQQAWPHLLSMLAPLQLQYLKVPYEANFPLTTVICPSSLSFNSPEMSPPFSFLSCSTFLRAVKIMWGWCTGVWDKRK